MVYRIKNCKILLGNGSGIKTGELRFSAENGSSRILSPNGDTDREERIIDAGGACLMPAFTDIGGKYFDPDYPARDTETSASAALTAGGYRRLVTYPGKDGRNKSYESPDPRIKRALPITDPEKIAENGPQIYYGESGELSSSELCEVFRAIAASGSLYISSGIDMRSVGDGALAEGIAAKMHSCRGISRSSECAELGKELFAAYETKARLHINALSCKEALDMIVFAKKAGVKVSCGVSPFHLSMTDSDIIFYGPYGKLLPPLRSLSDKNALREGLFSGDIDCLSSLHTPLTKVEKNLPVSRSPFGLCGIETTFSALITYMPELLSQRPDRIAEILSIRPAEIIGEKVSLESGAQADFVLADMKKELVVTENTLKSKSVNTPFLGQTLTGYITSLFIDGVRI